MEKKLFKNELKDLEAKGLLRSLTSRDNSGVVNLSSNDYLGLSHHPAVIQAAKEALDRYGAGGTSSRLLAGSTELHKSLEESLASFINKPASLVFSSGYHVNTGLLPALTGPEDIIFFDRFSHASLIDGIRLSRATKVPFAHNDLENLGLSLQKHRPRHQRAFIVTEGTFSMDGDEPPLSGMVELALKWDALMYLDEAHSFGVIGPHGGGLAARHNLLENIDVFVGTLSKSLGSQGGFVAGSRDLINLFISRARSFIYTTALAPLCAAAARASLNLFPNVEDRREKIRIQSNWVREELKKRGYNTLKSVSPIVPVWTGSVESTKVLSDHLFTHGFFVPSIRPPTVPVGEGRVRISITYDLSREELKKLLDAMTVFPQRPAIEGERVVQTN